MDIRLTRDLSDRLIYTVYRYLFLDILLVHNIILTTRSLFPWHKYVFMGLSSALWQKVGLEIVLVSRVKTSSSQNTILEDWSAYGTSIMCSTTTK